MLPLDRTGFSFRVNREAVSWQQEMNIKALEMVRRGARVSIDQAGLGGSYPVTVKEDD